MKSFNEKIWELTKKVPKGKVTTYKILAEKLGTKAYRAVGTAMNRNPNGLLNCGYARKMVPCHRVVASSGHLHGFSRGLKKKSELLEMEGIKTANNRIVNFDEVLFRFG